jgi:hypothetical protein
MAREHCFQLSLVASVGRQHLARMPRADIDHAIALIPGVTV